MIPQLAMLGPWSVSANQWTRRSNGEYSTLAAPLVSMRVDWDVDRFPHIFTMQDITLRRTGDIRPSLLSIARLVACLRATKRQMRTTAFPSLKIPRAPRLRQVTLPWNTPAGDGDAIDNMGYIDPIVGWERTRGNSASAGGHELLLFYLQRIFTFFFVRFGHFKDCCRDTLKTYSALPPEGLKKD